MASNELPTWRDHIEPPALNPIFLTDAAALASIAISLKRIADGLEGGNLDGFKNQLLDIAYQAGVNFRGQA